MLGNSANVEVNQAGTGDVDADADDGEPEEQILCLHAGEGVDLAATERTRDVLVVMQLALELGVAGLVEVHPEAPIGAHFEVLHALREEAHGQGVVAEGLVDGGRVGAAPGAGRGGRGWNEEEDEEEEGGANGDAKEGEQHDRFCFRELVVVLEHWWVEAEEGGDQ